LCIGWLPSPIFIVGGKPLQIFLGGGMRTHILSQCTSRSLMLKLTFPTFPFPISTHPTTIQPSFHNFYIPRFLSSGPPPSFLFFYATRAY
jgi:hypothetical protein